MGVRVHGEATIMQKNELNETLSRSLMERSLSNQVFGGGQYSIRDTPPLNMGFKA